MYWPRVLQDLIVSYAREPYLILFVYHGIVEYEPSTSIFRFVATCTFKSKINTCRLSDRQILLMTSGLSSGHRAMVSTWTVGDQRPSFVSELQRFDACVETVNGSALVIGGKSSTGTVLNDILRVSDGSLLPIPDAWSRHATASIGNVVFVSGGGWNGQRCSTRFSRFDHGWTTLRPFSKARDCHAMVATEKFIYVIGGRDEDGSTLTSVERYSLKEDIWEYTASLNNACYDLSAATIGEKVYVFRAFGVEEYDPDRNTWKVITRSKSQVFGAIKV